MEKVVAYHCQQVAIFTNTLLFAGFALLWIYLYHLRHHWKYKSY